MKIADAPEWLLQSLPQRPVDVPDVPRERLTLNGHANDGGRPGDAFNAAHTWEELLCGYGWTLVFTRGDEAFWRRPGKPTGISATTNYKDSDVFYPFTTSTEFEANRSYDRFGLYVTKEYGGDFAKAARALAGPVMTLTSASLPPSEPCEDDGGPRRYNRTEAGNAELFAAEYAATFRYDHRRKRWLRWAGHWWEPDTDGESRRCALAIARLRYAMAPSLYPEDLKEREAEAKWAIGSESRARLEALLTLAQNVHPLADVGDQWDTNPDLFGVENGVVELPTGRLRSGRPEDRVTMHTSLIYDPKARCDRWLRFLNEVFSGQDDLIAWIQRAVGYSLTGHTKEQLHFFSWGAGENGKSRFLTALRDVAGDYGADTGFATLEHNANQTIPADLAALQGKRFVTASETSESSRLNEARMKLLAGADAITARHLFGEFFTFKPSAKFWLAMNHKPKVMDDSHGFWRKIRMIPFLENFSGRADKDLEETLQREYTGILAWAVTGAVQWYTQGLDPMPVIVEDATKAYRNESDPLAGFIETCCVLGAEYRIQAQEFYQAYTTWAIAEGMDTADRLTLTTFGKLMTARFQKEKTMVGTFYLGVMVRKVSV